MSLSLRTVLGPPLAVNTCGRRMLQPALRQGQSRMCAKAVSLCAAWLCAGGG
jgi:hypothetical protein